MTYLQIVEPQFRLTTDLGLTQLSVPVPSCAQFVFFIGYTFLPNSQSACDLSLVYPFVEATLVSLTAKQVVLVAKKAGFEVEEYLLRHPKQLVLM